MSKDHITLGHRGEELACKFLKESGYKILESNYRGRLGEIDIVAEDRDCLVFVEVKTRTTLACGHPFESIDSRKQRQLVKVAREYLAKHSAEESLCRFDAVSVLCDGGDQPQIELIKNAFELDGGNSR